MSALAELTVQSVSVQFVGIEIVLDISGAIYIPGERTLVISDMHLAKGSSWARRGYFLPPYDSRNTLVALRNAANMYNPLRLVSLGDSFHDMNGLARLDPGDVDDLFDICKGKDTFWVTGNHDPEVPDTLPGTACDELAIGKMRFVHIPTKGSLAGEIAGHLHPAAGVRGYGRSVKRRCFVEDSERMILPAFGAYTGGLNVKNAAFHDLLDHKSAIAHVLGERQIYSIPYLALAR